MICLLYSDCSGVYINLHIYQNPQKMSQIRSHFQSDNLHSSFSKQYANYQLCLFQFWILASETRIHYTVSSSKLVILFPQPPVSQGYIIELSQLAFDFIKILQMYQQSVVDGQPRDPRPARGIFLLLMCTALPSLRCAEHPFLPLCRLTTWHHFTSHGVDPAHLGKFVWYHMVCCSTACEIYVP